MKALVYVTECKHPRYTHRVWYPGPDGARLNRFFTNETAALEFQKEQQKETGEIGTDFGSISEKERAALAFWREFVKESDPAPPDLIEVLRTAKERWKADKGSVTVADAVERYLEKQEAGGASERHLASLRSRLRRFAADLGARLVSSIQTGDFEDWLNGLRATRADKQGAALTTVTRVNLCRSLRSFFTYAEERGWTLRNPVPAAKRSKTKAVKMAVHKAPEILLPADAERFMQAIKQHAPALLAFWALKFFAGIRDAEAARMEWSMIDLQDAKIHLPARISKTGEQRTVKIEPNLAAWLKLVPKQSGRIAPGETSRKRGYKKALAALAEKKPDGTVKAPFVFPSNAARHCFGTFHLFHFRDAGETALQLGHKGNPAMLHEHYKNPAAEKHAAEFWNIYPGGKPRRKAAGKVVPMSAAPREKRRAAR